MTVVVAGVPLAPGAEELGPPPGAPPTGDVGVPLPGAVGVSTDAQVGVETGIHVEDGVGSDQGELEDAGV